MTATDWIVATNDAKYLRVAGRDTYPEHPGPDTLTLIDATTFPPRIVASVDVATTVAGPPQAVAIAPNGKLAVVSAPNRYDPVEKAVVLETCLQIVDLEAAVPAVVATVDVKHHPQGLAINRDGTLLLAATLGGTVVVLAIDGQTVTLRQELQLCQGRLAGISFTHDGSAALVALRDEGGLAVLDVLDGRLGPARESVTTGIAPYAIDVSSDGRWAVAGSVGLAGLAHRAGLNADADLVTLVDVSSRPFRAVQHLSVPSIPEGVAISPDGRWIAVQAMDGSNLRPDHPARRDQGRLLLFEIRSGQAEKVADLPAGEAGQGVVFSADSHYVLAQFNVEKQIAVYAVNGGQLEDTGARLRVSGGPASIRSMPR